MANVARLADAVFPVLAIVLGGLALYLVRMVCAVNRRGRAFNLSVLIPVRPDRCARAASGQAAAPPRSVMNCRRFICRFQPEDPPFEISGRYHIATRWSGILEGG
jgi:hypothetical protein